jgi:hypothetical protein
MFGLLQVEAVVVWDESVSLDLDKAGELDGHSAHCPLRFRDRDAWLWRNGFPRD